MIDEKFFKEAMDFVGLPVLVITEEDLVASKSYAEYQDKPKGNQQCSGCTMFRPPSSCTLVDGKISPEGWCRYYEADKKQT